MDNSLVWMLILFFLSGNNNCCNCNPREPCPTSDGCQPNSCNPLNLVLTCLLFSSCVGTQAEFLPGNNNPIPPRCPNA